MISNPTTPACTPGARYKLPVVVLGEEHGKHSFRGGAKEGLGAAWGSWRFACERLRKRGLAIVMSRVTRVNTKTWRAAYGMAGMSSKEAKAHAPTPVLQLLGITIPPDQHNAAEALLIGLWGTRAHLVGSKLPEGLMTKWAAERGLAAC